MAVYKVYRLQFTTPVHFGVSRNDYGISHRTLHSDSFYAAVTSSLCKIGIEIPDDGDLGVSISSLFPYYQANSEAEPIYFLPKPLLSRPYSVENIEHRKKIKKIEWLDIKHFELMLKGQNLFEGVGVLDKTRGIFLTDSDIDPDFITSQVQDRVTVSRSGNEDAVPFYLDRVMFKGKSGLYFMAEGDTALLDQGIELLQYEGLGSDRNVGNGQFEFAVDRINIDLPADANCQMALSMYIPKDDEELKAMLESDRVAYDLMRRGGWITTYPFNTLRKGYVYAFKHASVFAPFKSSLPKGTILNLGNKVPRIDHPIYRCGRSLFVPVNM